MSYRAAICREIGPPRMLRIETLARAPLPADYVRVRLHACGVNFPDLLMVAGRYQFKPDLPFSPGMEASGEVIETGADVSRSRIGERVITRHRCGGFAEEIALPARDCLPSPRGFSFAEAACFTAAHMTAFHALTTRTTLTRGETLLVLGAAGGVGLAAVEIGKHLGARVIAAVASSAEKRAAARSKGADETLAADAPDLTAQAREITQGRGVDVILDPVGWRAEEATRLIAFGGRILLVGFAARIPTYPANRVLKGASLIGVRAGEWGRAFPGMRAAEMRTLMALAEDGALRPYVSKYFSLEDASGALQWLADRRAVGRVALTLD